MTLIRLARRFAADEKLTLTNARV